MKRLFRMLGCRRRIDLRRPSVPPSPLLSASATTAVTVEDSGEGEIMLFLE